MLSGGIELLRDSTRKHIHRTLKYELGDSVQIFKDNKRYYITAEHRSEFLGQIRGMVQGKKSGFHHAELQRTRIKKDLAVEMLMRSWSSAKGLTHPSMR